jgi:hypothetical protein
MAPKKTLLVTVFNLVIAAQSASADQVPVCPDIETFQAALAEAERRLALYPDNPMAADGVIEARCPAVIDVADLTADPVQTIEIEGVSLELIPTPGGTDAVALVLDLFDANWLDLDGRAASADQSG